MGLHNPSPEELEEWRQTAARRNAILPHKLQIHGRQVTIICGNCESQYTRKLLPGRNDPALVCPGCKLRNYVPIEW